MRIADLKKIVNEAPRSGHVNRLEDVISELAEQELLEVHLFDKQKEYRAVKSESHRFKNGVIECMVDFSNNQYVFKAKIEKSEKKISTICHINYDPENGMAFIDNYRLSI